VSGASGNVSSSGVGGLTVAQNHLPSTGGGQAAEGIPLVAGLLALATGLWLKRREIFARFLR
jgi:LPXTG-motif cell wall-anchored protein